jgi:hypothetical protein
MVGVPGEPAWVLPGLVDTKRGKGIEDTNIPERRGTPASAPFSATLDRRKGSGGSELNGERWDDDKANRLLDGALAVLEAAGGWEGPDDERHDPATMLRFVELYFSESTRRRLGPHVHLMNQGIGAGNMEDLRLGVLGLLQVVLCADDYERGPLERRVGT